MKPVPILSVLRITLRRKSDLVTKNMLIKYFLVVVDERMEEVSGGGCKERPQKIGKGVYSF